MKAPVKGRMSRLEEARRIRTELLIGIFITAFLELAVGIWIADNKPAYALGVLAGAAIAAGLLWHMYKSLDEALDMDPDSAVKYARKKSILRLVMMGLAVGISGAIPGILNPLGMFFGILALKFGTYFQPLVHKYIFKKKEE